MLTLAKMTWLILTMCLIQGLQAKDSKNESSYIPIIGPIFTDYGPVFKVKERDLQLIKDFKYRVFFDISEPAQSLSQYNYQIESVARFINMHALNGVALENMDIAVVMHGGATRETLNHRAYQEKYRMNNPSLDLIEQLHAKGVKFYLCGQSLSFMKHNKTDLAEPISLALSAMTASTQLQAQGFTLIP